MKLFALAALLPACLANVSLDGPVYIGCYMDSYPGIGGTRDLPVQNCACNDTATSECILTDGPGTGNCVQFSGASSLTPLLCSAQCSDYKFFGLQRSGCYCGNDYGNQGGKAPESDCDSPCPGDGRIMCGDYDRNSIYAQPSTAPANASTNSTSDDPLDAFFKIDGAYYGSGSGGEVDVTNKCWHGSCDKGLPDQLERVNFPGQVLPVDLLLQFADLNNADAAFQQQGCVWMPRNSSMITYIHSTRCSGGVNGPYVSTTKATYKVCEGSDYHLNVFLTFQLPPNLCAQSCTSNSKCEGFTVDTQGQNCWLLSTNGGVTENTYWKVYNKVGTRETQLP